MSETPQSDTKLATESERERERWIILLRISQSEEVYLRPADSVNVNNR